ncbi:hypothetical protein CANCADRAFT_95075 [Tortispora caseinolytica NRRL Y-17796]|uniref:J domain-containing protein n=1 Tax=Tortispora caseinolytica NRRL Y-17796 TaxID=767744 RepID=A0A1E4TMB4_9ASCO|nr:hypothetical protein CANCADRAFT_95075 [Tortispora caseinolytica NRRL Y-17796]
MWFLPTLVLLVLSCLTHADSTASDPNLSSGNYDAAINAFNEALKLNPDDYMTLYKRSIANMYLGKRSAALNDLNTVIKLAPSFEPARIQRAQSFIQRGDWERAQEDYSAVGHDVSELKQLMNMEASVNEAIKNSDWAACIDLSSRLIDSSPYSARARDLRSFCYVKVNELQPAVVDLTNAVNLEPTNLSRIASLASLVYYYQGDYNQFLRTIQKCTRFDPDFEECKSLFKSVKAFNKDLEKHASLALGAEPKFIDNLVRKLQDIGEKLSVPDLVSKSYLLERLYTDKCTKLCEKHKYAEAKSFCQSALIYAPRLDTAHVCIAEALAEDDHFDEAIKLLEQEEKENPYHEPITKKLEDLKRRKNQPKPKNYYKILGVAKNADEKEIKSAYRAMTKKFHPDKRPADMSIEEAEAKMAEINLAYEVLSDPEQRRQHDMGIDPQNPGSGPQQQHQQPFNPFQGGQPFGQNIKFTFNGRPGGAQFNQRRRGR